MYLHLPFFTPHSTKFGAIRGVVASPRSSVRLAGRLSALWFLKQILQTHEGIISYCMHKSFRGRRCRWALGGGGMGEIFDLLFDLHLWAKIPLDTNNLVSRTYLGNPCEDYLHIAHTHITYMLRGCRCAFF